MQKTEILWIAKTTKALLEKGETDAVIQILGDVIYETESKKSDKNEK